MTSLRFWRSRLVLLLAAGVILGTGGYAPTVWAGGAVTVCDYATLSTVLAAPGDTATFGCSGTITVPAVITINNNTIIDATSQNVILSGNNVNGVFYSTIKFFLVDFLRFS